MSECILQLLGHVATPGNSESKTDDDHPFIVLTEIQWASDIHAASVAQVVRV
jgi:hypothetical protein